MSRKRIKVSKHTGTPVLRSAGSRLVQSFDGHIPPSALAQSDIYSSASIDDLIVRRVVDDMYFSLRLTVNDLEMYYKVFESKCFLKAYISYLKLKQAYVKRTACSCSIVLELRDKEDIFFTNLIERYVYRTDKNTKSLL
jgi:hypothetical protein